MIRRFKLFGLCGFLLLPGVASTQPVQDEEQATRKVVFRVLSLEASNVELFAREGDWVPFRLSNRRIAPGGELTLRGRQLVFFRKLDRPPNTETPPYRPVAVATLPEEGRHFLFIFSPASGQNGREFNVKILPRDNIAGEQGKVIFYNFSSQPLAGQLGEERFTLARGDSRVVEAQANQNFNVGLRLAAYAEDQWNLAFSTVWGKREDLNTLVLVFDHPRRNNQIRVRRFLDTPLESLSATQDNR